MSFAFDHLVFDHFTFLKCYVIIGLAVIFVGMIEFFRIQRELKKLDRKLKNK